MHCVIFDIDGTLTNIEHRVHHISGGKKNYDAFFDDMVDDLPNSGVCMLAEIVGAYRHFQDFEFDTGALDPPFAIFICSGRPDSHREQTEKWLKQNVPTLYEKAEAVLMRKAGDYRSDVIVKREMLQGIRGQGFDPVFAVDDRQRVVDMWREEGITCLQCDASEWDKGEVRCAPGDLILLVGPSCAGKSTYAQSRFLPDEIISSDRMRLQLCGDFTDQSCNDQMWAGLHAVVKARVTNGFRTVVDATNLRNRDRRAIRELVPAATRIEYHVINRAMDEKDRDADWRADVRVKNGTPLIQYHEEIFKNNLKAILNGDGDSRVRVKDLRS